MAFSRYRRDPRLGLGSQLSTARAVSRIRSLVKSGELPIAGQIIATGADRLDSIAGVVYGDAKYWWVLAAASDIGWGLQVPPGTVLNIVDLRSVESAVG